jgi:DNA-binding response OmpR family regulator
MGAESNPTPRILLISGDLMAGSWLTAPAAQAGAKLDTTGSTSAALEMAGKVEYQLVIVDLNVAGKDLADVVEGLRRANASVHILAYGPHVQNHLLDAARDAGCDQVLTRGQFHAQAAEIIAGGKK